MGSQFGQGEPRERVEAFGRSHRTGLVTLLFTDMAGSTALKQKLGDRAAADLFRKHHQLIRDALARFPQGQEIETAGDSFLLVFATPSDAVQFALLAQAQLRTLAAESNLAALDRIGIHVGEVVVGEDRDARNPKDLFGLQIDTCARVMSLAKAGQVLMTRGVFDSARQVLKGGDLEGIRPLSWLNHGPYLLKGLDEPVEICEVREAGPDRASPSSPPTSSEKAQRQARAGEELVLGWRPALGQVIPNTRWTLEKKLGEGGFGEVWLGRHQHTAEHRVFKFCFLAERIRYLKRETTLFRVLKERVGEHPNIARLHDVFLEQPPFYLEMDYVEGADLRNWCFERGGVRAVPLETRLEIVIQAAEGLHAAHEAGIIHRDIKPANVLIGGKSANPADVRVKVTDFGIGQVVSEEYLKGITRAGFTQTILSDSSSGTGTHLYMAPELLAGQPATVRSDIYSLGVVLFQLLAGDFVKPVTTDWARHIQDPLLRQDLEQCFAGDPGERLVSAKLLADRLRALPERRAALLRQEQEIAARERAAYRRGIIRTAGVATAIIVAIAGLAIVAYRQSREAKAAARTERLAREERDHLLYAANLNLVQQAWDESNLGRMRELLAATETSPDRGFEWLYWQRMAHLNLTTFRGHEAVVACAAFSPDGQRVATASWDHSVKVWDASTGRELLHLNGHSANVNKVVFSPDGRRLISGGNDELIIVWNAETGKPLRMLAGAGGPVDALAISPDGSRIAAGTRRGTAKILDAASGNILSVLEHATNVLGLAFSPDNQKILTMNREGAGTVWDLVTGKLLFVLEEQSSGFAPCAAWSSDGRWIATGDSDWKGRLWDAATGRLRGAFARHTGEILSVGFSPDSQRLITSSGDKSAKLWDLTSREELFTLKGHNSDVIFAGYSPDGRRIVTTCGDWMSTAEHTAKVWDAHDPREVLECDGDIGPASAVAFSPDDRRLVIAGEQSSVVKVRDTANGKELLQLTGHTKGVQSCAFSRNGRHIITASFDKTVKLWDSATGQLLMTFAGFNHEVNGASFSPDGARVVTAGDGSTAQVWQATTGKLLATLVGHLDSVFQALFSPDGQWIATCSKDSTIKIWDATTWKLARTLTGHSALVVSIAFSRDGERLVSGSSDFTARIWDWVKGQSLVTCRGHRDQIWAVDFSPDGRRIVTGSQDGTAKIWDTVRGNELLTLKGRLRQIRGVSWSPGGNRIATASWDGIARIWPAASPTQVTAWEREEADAVERLAAARGERETDALREKSLRAQDPGALKAWLVLAPIPYSTQTHEGALAALDEALLPEESMLHPKAGERVMFGKSSVPWKALELPDYMVDFNAFLGKQEVPWSVAYAVCYVQSDSLQTRLLMRVGSDDEAKVFVNGKEVARIPRVGAYVPDQAVFENIELRAGSNIVILKVVNELFGWQASVRFTDAAGQPVKGLRVTLTPP